MIKKSPKDEWLYEITPKNNLFSLNLKEVWQYRDLLLLFVKRDITTVYKQTILGPLWYIIQPLFTAIIFTIIFNRVANIRTGEIPPFLFNLAGITVWTFFKNCLTRVSGTFGSNSGIFSKVYFPRLIMPLSAVITNLFKFGIQFFIFIVFYVYYVWKGVGIALQNELWLFPILIIVMGGLGLGLGLIVTSMVTKYKDLKNLINFGVQLLMYLSAVMYPMALISEKLPKWAWLIEYNPIAYIIEATRYLLVGEGIFTMKGVLFALFSCVIVLLVGIILFNRTEKKFVDTI